MLEKPTSKVYDLESRTLAFAKSIRHFITKLDKSILNIDDAKQLIRSSGSIAANYIEANESITKREFIHRANISKKEAKESLLWLRLIDCENDQELILEQKRLIQETEYESICRTSRETYVGKTNMRYLKLRREAEAE